MIDTVLITELLIIASVIYKPAMIFTSIIIMLTLLSINSKLPRLSYEKKRSRHLEVE